MNLAALDAILLAMFSIPVVMKYRILPVDGTPYWLFGIIFVLIFGNILYSQYFNSLNKKIFTRIKIILTIIIITLVLGGAMWTAIADRGKIAPGQNLNVHDIILQLEAALRFLGKHRNPYAETYFGTPMEKWHYAELGKDAVNPALYHFVMPPWYLLFSYPFYYVSMRTFGFFDGRMPLFFCTFGLGVFSYLLFRKKDLGRLAVVLILLSPATTDYLLEGRSDMFSLFWLVASLYFLKRRQILFSVIIFSLAVLSKQTIWFMVPLYIGYIWYAGQKSYRDFGGKIGIMLLIGAIICLPFLIWNAHAFMDSVILYLSGNTAHGYPVSGYGLGMVLYDAGIIKDIHGYFPFFVFQGVFGIAALIWGYIWVMKKPQLSRLTIAYAFSLLVIWYVSRYFNNSHVAFVSSLFVLGILLDADENRDLYETNIHK